MRGENIKINVKGKRGKVWVDFRSSVVCYDIFSLYFKKSGKWFAG